jgi:Carbohydrate esterase, sialic acid-specific acetylesterase
MRRGVVRRAMALLVAVATCMVATSQVPASAGVARRASPRKLNLLIVAGQSNALGYQSYVTDPHTHQDVFTDAGRSPADRRVLLMWDETQVPSSGPTPVPLDTPQVLAGTSSAVFGPEVGLARYLYRAGHHHLLVVKVAFSGSSLAEDWTPASMDFKALVSSVAAAVTWAKGHGWAPTLAGLYWMQGETDAMSEALASAYRSNLKAFLTYVRADLRLPRATPIVLGQIDLSQYISFQQSLGLCTATSCAEERTWNREVMRAQAQSVSWRTFLARTSRLPRYEYFLHLSDLGELALGKEFGELSAKHLT